MSGLVATASSTFISAGRENQAENHQETRLAVNTVKPYCDNIQTGFNIYIAKRVT